MGYPGSIFDIIRMYKSDGNFEEFLSDFPYGVIFGAIESTMFGVSDSSKLGEEIGCK